MRSTIRVFETIDCSRVAGITLATFALVTTAACGGKQEVSHGETAVAAVTPPVVATTPDSSPNETPVPAVASQGSGSFQDAESMFKQKRYKESTEMFASYVQRRPENAFGHYMLGLSAWKLGELERAQGAFERSLELDPKHVKTLLNLSRVLIDRDLASEALVRMTAAVALDSTSSEVHRMMGRVRTELRQNDQAVQSYRTALSIEPTDVWSMNNMGLLLIQQGRYDEAIPPLARAVQLDSTVPVFNNNLGLALERTGHFSAAANAYRTAITVGGGYQKASQSLARIEGRKDDPSVVPIELASVAAAFDREVRGGVRTASKPER